MAMNGAALGNTLKGNFETHCTGGGLAVALRARVDASSLILSVSRQIAPGSVVQEPARIIDDIYEALGEGLRDYLLGNSDFWTALGTSVVNYVKTATVSSGGGSAVKSPASIS